MINEMRYYAARMKVYQNLMHERTNSKVPLERLARTMTKRISVRSFLDG